LHIESSRWLISRKWLDRSISASWYCISRHGRFLLESWECCAYTSRTPCYSCLIENTAAARIWWLYRSSWQWWTIIIQGMMSGKNQIMSAIPVLGRFESWLCALLEGSWLVLKCSLWTSAMVICSWPYTLCEMDPSLLAKHARPSYDTPAILSWNVHGTKD
jgi:hypothetical protein